MENKATLIAVSGVVAMGVGLIASAVATGTAVDSGTIQQIITGLLGFASGVGATVVASAFKA